MEFTVRILATDLEGLGSAGGSAADSCEAFCDAMRSLRPGGDVLWVAFSDRSRRSALRRLSPFENHGRMPDFLIVRHLHIYRRTRIGYVPCALWSVQLLAHLILYPLRARRALDEWYEAAVRRFERMRTMIRSEDHLRLRFDSMEDEHAALASLGQVLRPHRNLRVVCTDLEAEIKPVPFIKGLALSELCRHLRLEGKDVLAIVFRRSDLSLIDKDVAAFCGCAANSDSRIMRAVHESGGHVARSKSLNGALEVLRAYREGWVCSDLPGEWRVSKKETSFPERPWSDSRKQKTVLRAAALGLCLYLILAVFASFVPGPISDFILKPCNAVAAGVGYLLQLW